MDNYFKLESPWEEVKEKLKELNISLTDEDLQYQPGEEEKLLSHLSVKLGKDKAAVKGLIESVSFNKGKAS